MLAGSAAALAAAGGCIERRIIVTSEPPGATVWVNDAEIGRTPAEVGFTYFGVYDVRLRKDGFEPISTRAEAKAPLYEYPPFDLVAEALPGTNETVVKWHFVLEPALERRGDARAAEAGLLERARELAAEAAPPPPPPEPSPEPKEATGDADKPE